MIITDGTAVDLIKENEPAPSAYVMKFDPSKKIIKKVSDNLRIVPSARKTNIFEVIETVLDNRTTMSSHGGVELLAELAMPLGTAVDHRQQWPTLPKFFDYVEVESLYDADEIEDIFLHAAKKRGW